jgi:hypothetical protein
MLRKPSLYWPAENFPRDPFAGNAAKKWMTPDLQQTVRMDGI